MGEEKYPDVIELKLKLRFSLHSLKTTVMKKSVEFSKETIAVIESKKRIAGEMIIDQVSGVLTFKMFNRGKRKKDILVAELESGWLKESPTRMKFFSSVKKSVGTKHIRNAMNRDLTAGMDVLEGRY